MRPDGFRSTLPQNASVFLKKSVDPRVIYAFRFEIKKCLEDAKLFFTIFIARLRGGGVRGKEGRNKSLLAAGHSLTPRRKEVHVLYPYINNAQKKT